MAGRNPAIDPPRFPSPEVYRSDSPSSKRSPTRHSRNFSKSGDPLLRDLSPTSTLRAFTETAVRSEDQLARSVGAASNSERAFGARIAQTCKDILKWAVEVERWEWPGTFESPSEPDSTAPLQLTSGERSDLADSAMLLSKEEGAHLLHYWGCLPEHTIMSYEKRVEDIRDALEELDVDGLKDHVLSAHVQPKSQPLLEFDDIAQHSYHSPRLQHLDDFTALITATILQALPYLSRLNKLLNSWSVRLTVLRKVPGYTRELEQAQAEVGNGWSEMSRNMEIQSNQDHVDLPRLMIQFNDIRERLERKILRLGTRLDSMLDDLEGRDETIPDRWIDAFETLETNYGDWVVQTERELTSQNLHLLRRMQGSKSQSQAANAKLDDTIVATQEVSGLADKHERRDLAQATAVLLPVSGVDLDTAIEGQKANESLAPPTIVRARSEDTLAPDDQFSAPLDHVESPVLGNGQTPHFGDDAPSDSDSDEPQSTKAMSTKNSPIVTEPSLSRTPSIQADQPLTTKSPVRSRHVPIFVDYEDIRATSAPEVVTDAFENASLSSRHASVSSNQPTTNAGNKVRARAAFLNGGVEKSQSLQKTASPPIVRPFEHASQAFTKLFQLSNTALHSRSSSTSSRTSVRKGLGLGIRNDADRGHHRSNPSAGSSRSFHVSDNNVRVDPAELNAEENRRSGSHTAVELPCNNEPVEKPESEYGTFITPETQYGFEPSTRESKSTIASTWTSPALSDFPDNWPLPLGMNGEEISSPKKPLDSDSFEKMFVDSLPTTPNRTAIHHSQEENPLERMLSFNTNSKPNGTNEPVLNNIVVVPSEERNDASGSSPAGSRPAPRPRQLRAGSNTDMQRAVLPISEVPTPGSFQSDLSTPSVHDASAVGYFTSQAVQTPSPASRTSSGGTARHPRSPLNQIFPLHSDKRDSPESLGVGAILPESEEQDCSSFNDNERVPLAKRESRASVTSIEYFPRSQLKTVDIADVRRSSSFSAGNSPLSPVNPSSPTSLSRDLPSPEQVHNNAPVVLSGMPTPVLRPDVDRSLYDSSIRDSDTPPLNISMPKRRNNAPAAALDTSPLNSKSEGAKTPASQTTPVKRMHRRTESTTEQLDRHVSRVLSSLPAKIRFTPVSSNLSVESGGAPNPSSGPRPRPSLAPKSSRTGLTLSPALADSGPNKKASANEPEVKLYHLTQEGKEQPIKLYVRLVGENERVMVRVGGGWADLGEYLRQYAEHHGRRTVSDGKFEIQGVSGNNNGSMKIGSGPKVRTPLSRPGSVLDRPSSALGHRRPSMNSTQTPNDGFVSPISSPNPDRTATPTPSSSSGSRPATSDEAQGASPASWAGAEIGLAGPASKKSGGLDGQKARWVEDMIDRAKQASTEKKKTEEKAWGSMGRIGGTRRMIFKQQKPEAGSG
ncbi:hypothetical protein MBLNU459_g3466t1 [Dothideomycetes sp. NU459]